MLFVIFCWSAVSSILTLDSNDKCSVPIRDTSNFRYMATKVPSEAGDYLIFRPKVDRWVDSTQCDYVGLIFEMSKFRNISHSTFGCSKGWPPPLWASKTDLTDLFHLLESRIDLSVGYSFNFTAALAARPIYHAAITRVALTSTVRIAVRAFRHEVWYAWHRRYHRHSIRIQFSMQQITLQFRCARNIRNIDFFLLFRCTLNKSRRFRDTRSRTHTRCRRTLALRIIRRSRKRRLHNFSMHFIIRRWLLILIADMIITALAMNFVIILRAFKIIQIHIHSFLYWWDNFVIQNINIRLIHRRDSFVKLHRTIFHHRILL